MLCAALPRRIYESLKALCCLANAVGPLRAHEVAAAAGLPPAQTAKILQLMTWAGFIESRRGTKGGFWLIIPADQIRVTDVADFFAHHAKGKFRQERDPLLKALAAATARCQKDFAHITVADLARVSGCEAKGSKRVRNTVSALLSRKPAPLKNAARERSRR
jgi:DNA-binding IscR family transcriptional regulator